MNRRLKQIKSNEIACQSVWVNFMGASSQREYYLEQDCSQHNELPYSIFGIFVDYLKIWGGGGFFI